MYAMRLLFIAALGVAFAAMPALAAAEVYRWVDENGNVHYGDKPRDGSGAEPAELPELQSFDPKKLPPVRSTAPKRSASKPAVPDPSIRISSPAEGETLREAGNVVTVQVALGRPLVGRQGIRFFLDGKPVNAVPVPDTRLSIPQVYRGEHTVSAAVIDRSGRVMYSSPTVTFYMKPPTARR